MPEIATVAVIGAGRLGRDVAQAIAKAGYRTILEDILPSSLRKAENEFRVSINQAVDSGAMTALEAQAAVDRLEYAESIEDAARQADVVIEAVPEELESKIEIFTLLDKICRPSTLLVTTSIESDVTQLASTTYRQDRCIGMRFGAPPQRASRIQVVKAQETSDDTLAAISHLARKLSGDVVLLDLPDGFAAKQAK